MYVALAYNGSFLRATTTGRSWEATETWFFVGALVISLIALHGLIFSIAVARWSVRPLLTASVLVAAFATFYMQRYGVYYDPSMLRNVLRTDTAEASELISWSLIAHVSLYSAVPLWAI
ncbi:DUF1705 domain-containing protein, partial [Corallococcus coralloides]|nr:DUF1705 domain-containing protein [Corallococcus coralloides]